MEDLKYTSQQDYESICEVINIIGLEIDNILAPENYSIDSVWGNRILKIKTIEEPEEIKLPKRLTDPEYGNIDLNTYLQNSTADFIAIEEVRKITNRLPSLTKILIEDRQDE